MKKIRNIIVGQSGGPTTVINSSLAGVYRTAKVNGVENVYGMRHGIQGLLEEKNVNMCDYIKGELEIELLKRTPSSYLGSCRYKLPKYTEDVSVYEKIFGILNKLEIDAFFYIGGNDSMDTIAKLSAYATTIDSPIRFIGVPKTIDNDLAVTDHTPGFGSAAKFIASTVKELMLDGLVYDTSSVTVLEIMGRNAGWLTAASALARGEDCTGPDVILLPEVPVNLDEVVEKVNNIQKTKKSVIIAISEGAKMSDGRYVCELVTADTRVDAFGHKALTGAGRCMADKIAHDLKCKTRAVEFSTIQRCAAHILSRVDMTEAFQVGASAFNEAAAGNTGKMITLERRSSEPYICVTGSHDVQLIANLEKKVPVEWINKDEFWVNDEFIRYARPLIQAELYPFMIDGVPKHIVLPC
ncbi:MAG: 6-phosphofructokinase [Lachnospiraceae bacterium]|nr:6-phosphofructokinase [Lachnospiraceae bacterium]